MCRYMTITYSCGCLTRSVEACPHSLSMKIAPEDCQFHFSEPIHKDERDCLSCVIRTTQRNQKKLESMKLEDFHVANLKFPPSPSPPRSHPKSLGTRVLKEQEKAKKLDTSYQVPVRRESGEEEDDEETPRQSFSQPPTPREIESRLPAPESQRQGPVAEPRTVPVEGEVEPFTPKKLVRKMSEGVKKMARRFSKKK
ncbi:uncharacterized protein Bfra_007079 [Botrytis fragariae]|uniref:Uncharacterized protein n=1 Tax=Botrytis fragariae TaxID=1964551 RepID=A0A8H6ED47_9HELO|nr:uncharacterized protein Bfra_007079 [Botrytis fragariae]KAF5867884.1 hypothetical protein Bfra_007079 [Botrytis fragariae]